MPKGALSRSQLTSVGQEAKLGGVNGIEETKKKKKRRI
jgi:hypothetical protein